MLSMEASGQFQVDITTNRCLVSCSPFMETASSCSEVANIVVIGDFLIIVVRRPDTSPAFVRSLSF